MDTVSNSNESIKNAYPIKLKKKLFFLKYCFFMKNITVILDVKTLIAWWIQAIV